uniref:Uncharacterized protein n=1 Tax=Meloidogyne enterolobii TaxID=390850 RepID=A0A6V7VVM7_MELEN|nr:unnamed protein product [Meloidogyne enterolobii]
MTEILVSVSVEISISCNSSFLFVSVRACLVFCPSVCPSVFVCPSPSVMTLTCQTMT